MWNNKKNEKKKKKNDKDIGRGLSSGHIIWYQDDNCSSDNSSSGDSDNSSSGDNSISDSSSGGE